MAKFETFICGVTWGVMNALLIALALGAATPPASAPKVLFGSATSAPLA